MRTTSKRISQFGVSNTGNTCAIVSVALSSTVFAANLEEGQITGTVVDADAITIDTAKGQRWYFKRDLDSESIKPLKVGEKVTVHHYITGRGNVYAKKIEKAGTPIKLAKRNDGELVPFRDAHEGAAVWRDGQKPSSQGMQPTPKVFASWLAQTASFCLCQMWPSVPQRIPSRAPLSSS
jgi:hypothetical protein